MNPETDQKSLLINAVRHPVSAFTVVETDTRHRAQSLINELLPFVGGRPCRVFDLDPEAGAVALIDHARKLIENWPSESGLLFLVEVEKNQMNPLRTNSGAR